MWNVNFVTSVTVAVSASFSLTMWNVNVLFTYLIKSATGFSLTMWNVNKNIYRIVTFRNFRFSLTMWNVNGEEANSTRKKGEFFINYVECE